jgi:hypothetical protein
MALHLAGLAAVLDCLPLSLDGYEKGRVVHPENPLFYCPFSIFEFIPGKNDPHSGVLLAKVIINRVN